MVFGVPFASELPSRKISYYIRLPEHLGLGILFWSSDTSGNQVSGLFTLPLLRWLLSILLLLLLLLLLQFAQQLLRGLDHRLARLAGLCLFLLIGRLHLVWLFLLLLFLFRWRHIRRHFARIIFSLIGLYLGDDLKALLESGCGRLALLR